ncbi:decaprenyl-diphosphate synthase subunit 1 [Uncinocarpus reesii 1704]|uniref:Decaprenyl-diphosphate synthase subunit 1 n=1 Tax=Uncinocarpus reesii (strain UAMH 1704) TaxID=336963 RepID=C4JEA0_UNCRE|nr:decaprenyl-diphosphate synthase subunit 1 [Uncinocarpus reesii 1704]EEP75676.1 decaprenyl-diphosphate synthase subunit 1 [Uncinocarpus reesii 1704]
MKARSGLRAWRGLAPTSISSRPAASICSQCLLHTKHRLFYVPPTLSFTYRSYHPSRRKNQQSVLSAAVSTAQNFISKTIPTKPPPATGNGAGGISEVSVDPLRMVAKELKFLKKNIRQLLGSGHPLLDRVAKYYARSEGKQVRPLLVLLISQATALMPRSPRDRQILDAAGVNAAISSPAILADTNPDYNLLTAPSLTGNETAYTFAESDENILPSQRRLAEITELIHTASLLHDDVIDNAVTRRSGVSANLEFGNKMAVLAGDFLLGRASVALARLRDPEVTELMATVIANLVEGEFMQLRNTAQDERNPAWTEDIITYYLQKTYLKSASLISKSCRSAALLGHGAPDVVEAAYSYGRNLGLAFQLVDDMLDYTISGEELGKPAGADLELGLATAPLLFAWKSHPELGALVGRKFCHEGDVQLARQIVSQSDGLEQTRALAQEYSDKAVQAISIFPDSEAKRGLIDTCEKVMIRRK